MNIKFKTVIKLFSLLLLIILTKTSYAQTEKHALGVQFGGISDEGNIERISITSGLFYDYKFNNRFGINIGGLYRRLTAEGFSYTMYSENNPDPPLVKFVVQYFEVPVNLSLNLNKRPGASWKTNLLAGGTYSYYLGFKEKDLNGKATSKFNSTYSRAFIYGNFGVEVSHKLSDKYILGLNPGLRIGVSTAYPEGDIYFMIKLGRIL